MLRFVLCCATALAGCYEPKLAECTVRCSGDTDCGPDQACRSDGWCATTGFTESCGATEVPVPGVVIDASVDGTTAMPDAPPAQTTPDAPPAPACAPGCGGTCENGVCVIRCSGQGSCHDQVLCPPTGPCRVECSGTESCHDGVRCGFGRCTVHCSGDDSCRKKVRCETSCSCDVTCTGEDTCREDSSCPLHPWCEWGDGCTSAPNGCNAC